MSSPPRLYLPSLSSVSSVIPLGVSPARYLFKVLRKKEGDLFLGIDGQGGEYDLILQGRDLENPTAKVLGMRVKTDSGNISIALGQGLPKGTKMDGILRQCTEVGIDRFIPVLTKRSVSRPHEDRRTHKVERWGKILLEACRQSGRSSIPQLDPVVDWPAFLSIFKEFDLVIMPYERDAPALGGFLEARPAPGKVLVLIGPEGGWAPEEVLEAEREGAFSVHLPTPILRTDTAGLSVASMLRFFYDRTLSKEKEIDH